MTARRDGRAQLRSRVRAGAAVGVCAAAFGVGLSGAGAPLPPPVRPALSVPVEHRDVPTFCADVEPADRLPHVLYLAPDHPWCAPPDVVLVGPSRDV